MSADDVAAEHASPGEPPRGEVSPRLTSATRVIHNLRVPMRDGVELALDLLRPELPDPLPVVLLRTPYDKVLTRTIRPELYEALAQRGYIVAFNDCRGRFNSDGVFRPYFDEADDGFDTVEWIAAQDWCDGKVGMTGGSYVGQTQWYAASRRPPHLKAIVPIVSPPSTLWRNEPVVGGCFLLPMSEWAVGMGLRSWQVPDFVTPLFAAQQDYYDALPLSSLPERAGMTCAWWDAMMQHPAFDAFWRQGSYDNHQDIDVAALNITGWWDMNFPGAPLNFEAMHAGPAAARQKLIIGPWPHWVNRLRRLSGVDFGEHAIIQLDDYVIRFFDRYLKGISNGIEDEKPVHVFVIGANQWWAEDTWPLPGTEHVEFYFHSGGHASSLRGDGATPTRVLWNLREGPVDDRLATIGDDCLCYTSEPLTEPLDVVGWVGCTHPRPRGTPTGTHGSSTSILTAPHACSARAACAHPVRPQHELRSGELLHRRHPRRCRSACVPRAGDGVLRRAAGGTRSRRLLTAASTGSRRGRVQHGSSRVSVRVTMGPRAAAGRADGPRHRGRPRNRAWCGAGASGRWRLRRGR